MSGDRISLDAVERATMPGQRPGAVLRVQLEAPPPASPLAGLRAGASIAIARLRRRGAALTARHGAALVIVGAQIELRAGTSGAVDRALTGAFRLVIPLVVLLISAEAAGRGNLREGLWPLARYGVSRRDLALGVVAVNLGAAAILAAALAALAVLVAHGPSAPPLLADAAVSAWIGALAGMAHAATFALGGAFGKRGWARLVPFFAHFMLAGSTSFAAALLPGAHAQSLLGGAAPLHLSPPGSYAALLIQSLLFTLLVALKCRE
ncbi:MAG: hypothetical protein U0359_01595 [Byssovorax sp.]